MTQAALVSRIAVGACGALIIGTVALAQTSPPAPAPAAAGAAGVCDQAKPEAYSETAPANNNPAAIRIVFFPYADPVPGPGFCGRPEPFLPLIILASVSYTHLTLPTNREV